MERDRCEQELHVCKYGGIHKVEDYVFLQRMSAVCFLLAFLSAAHAVILFFRLDIGGIMSIEKGYMRKKAVQKKWHKFFSVINSCRPFFSLLFLGLPAVLSAASLWGALPVMGADLDSPAVEVSCSNADQLTNTASKDVIRIIAEDPETDPHSRRGISCIEIDLYEGEEIDENKRIKNAFSSEEDNFQQDRFVWDEEQEAIRDPEEAGDKESGFKREAAFRIADETLNGEYTLAVRAVNYSGKHSPVHTIKLLFDNSAPRYEILLDDKEGSGIEGTWYYSANHGEGITVIFYDDHMKEAEGESGSSGEYRIILCDQDRGSVEAGSRGSRTEEGEIIRKAVISAEEISKLSEGEISVFVKAVDAAGNAAGAAAAAAIVPEELTVDEAEAESDGNSIKAAAFVLDRTSPDVTGIETRADPGVQGYPVTDNRIYIDDDRESVYYNEAVTVEISVRDDHIGKQDAGIYGSVLCGSAEKEAEQEKSVEGLTLRYVLDGDACYEKLVVGGSDYAGNPLILSPDYGHDGISDDERDSHEKYPDQLTMNGEGVISSLYGKTIDRTAPIAVIRYKSETNPNVYSGETDVPGRKTVYFNHPIGVSISFSDNNKMDGSRLFAGREGSETKLTEADGKTEIELPEIEITEEGHNVFTAYGTDRALNPTQVVELIETEDGRSPGSVESKEPVAAGAFDASMEKQSPLQAEYEIVLDRTPPVFRFDVDSPASANKAINEQGNRYYFNGAYTAAFTVYDLNFDAERINVRKGTAEGSRYNSETTSVNSFPVMVSGEDTIFSDTEDKDGVYRYIIGGSDKAGNALIPSDRTNIETSSEEGDITVHIVVDRKKPAGALNITAGKKTLYQTNTLGNVTFAEPYSKRTKALIRISVNEKTERSPVSVSYRIESTVGSDRKEYSDPVFRYNNFVETAQTGKQIFRVAEYRLTDLAGNEMIYHSDNRIYLDCDHPEIDRIAPTIDITARLAAGSELTDDSHPLFHTDVPLRIEVTDPDGGSSSSGLADVEYRIYIDGRPDPNDSGKLHRAIARTHRENYRDEELTDHLVRSLTVQGESHNNNRIQILVTAYDHAGNMSEKNYSFGIDVTAPGILVTYDNNNARGGEYFNSDRTATVTVTERNFDPSYFQISTQKTASVSSWYHVKNGGNGDQDTWTAHVQFSVDGNYTLEVSGRDIAGNRASQVQYTGTAPQKFTIDKTAPAVSVTYDNNDVRNGKYYRVRRTAAIYVSDANFDGQNDIRVLADKGGSAPEVHFAGDTARLSFNSDGTYSFRGSVTDRAGNRSSIPEQAEFVIDTRPPVLIFEDGKPFRVEKAEGDQAGTRPVNMQFFTDKGFAPVVSVLDTNLSTAQNDAVFEVTGHKPANRFTGSPVQISDDRTRLDLGISSLVFRMSEEIDDVYHVRAYAVDLAGNESGMVEFDFSINRFGSSYAAERDDRFYEECTLSTYDYLRGSFYHNSVHDLTIYEYNTNGIREGSQNIEMMKDGNTATVTDLKQGMDYLFEEIPNRGSKLHSYRYIIKEKVFEQEGDYSFIISSVDEAGHRNTTSRVHRSGKGKNGKEEQYVEAFPIDFVIDRTVPVNRLGGVLQETRQTINDTHLKIDVFPEDAVSGVAKVEIRRWLADSLGMNLPSGEESPAETCVYAYYDENKVLKPADTETVKYIDLNAYTDQEAGRIRIEYELDGSRNWQWIEVITTDQAGNESRDIRSGFTRDPDGNSYTEGRLGFLVTTNRLLHLINSLAVRIGSAAFLAAVLLLLILRSSVFRKKENEPL